MSYYLLEKSAGRARVRLEYEHVSPDLDLVSLVSRGDCWLIPRHLEFESDRLQIKIDCGANISILEILPGQLVRPYRQLSVPRSGRAIADNVRVELSMSGRWSTRRAAKK